MAPKPASVTHEFVAPDDYEVPSNLDPAINGKAPMISAIAHFQRHFIAASAAAMLYGQLTIKLLAGTMANPVYKGERAKQYPFTLDGFQEISIACLVMCLSQSSNASITSSCELLSRFKLQLACRRGGSLFWFRPTRQQERLPSLSKQFAHQFHGDHTLSGYTGIR